MFTIQSYTDTQCELDMAKTRLNLLMDRKEKLYYKYFPITPQLKQDVVDGGIKNKDKMAEYVHELHEVDIGTGKSLAGEIEYQQLNVDKLQSYLDNIIPNPPDEDGVYTVGIINKLFLSNYHKEYSIGLVVCEECHDKVDECFHKRKLLDVNESEDKRNKDKKN